MNVKALLPFILILLSALQVSCGPASVLQRGECDSDQSISTTIAREADSSNWCLKSRSGAPLATKWSENSKRFAYALFDGTERRTYKGTSWEKQLYKWYVIDLTSNRLFRYRGSNNEFTWSPDGVYAIESADPLRIEMEDTWKVVKIDSGELICRYRASSGFYSPSEPNCDNLILTDGTSWNIKDVVNTGACEFRASPGYGVDSEEQDNICKDLINDWDSKYE